MTAQEQAKLRGDQFHAKLRRIFKQYPEFTIVFASCDDRIIRTERKGHPLVMGGLLLELIEAVRIDRASNGAVIQQGVK
jgi:hypothetical protein